MRPTADPMCIRLFLDNRPRHSSSLDVQESLTIQNRIDDNLGSASSMVETWLRCVVILPDEHTCLTFSIARLGFHRIVSAIRAQTKPEVIASSELQDYFRIARYPRTISKHSRHSAIHLAVH